MKIFLVIIKISEPSSFPISISIGQELYTFPIFIGICSGIMWRMRRCWCYISKSAWAQNPHHFFIFTQLLKIFRTSDVRKLFVSKTWWKEEQALLLSYCFFANVDPPELCKSHFWRAGTWGGKKNKIVFQNESYPKWQATNLSFYRSYVFLHIRSYVRSSVRTDGRTYLKKFAMYLQTKVVRLEKLMEGSDLPVAAWPPQTPQDPKKQVGGVYVYKKKVAQ